MLKSKFITICICLASYVTLGQNQSLKQLLAESHPLVCGHRGGYYSGYPENSIEVTDFILNKISQRPIMIEIDLRSDQGGKIWLMHDNTLDRTTNDTGEISSKSSEYLKKINLKSQHGAMTTFKMVSFEEYLLFAADKPIYLMLDIKDIELYPKIDVLLSKFKMADRSIVLTFSVENTKKALECTKNTMISMLVSNDEEFNEYKKLQNHHHRLGTYVTDSTPDSLINYLDKANTPLISDPRELWNKKTAPETSDFYHSFIRKKQLDILVTDFPVEVIQMLHNENELRIKIQNLHLKKFKWLVDKQIDSLTTLLHDDVFYIHSNGWKENKTEVIANILSGKLTYNDVRVQESTVRIVDNTAVVTGKGTFYVSLEGKSSEFNLFYTEVYVMTNSGIRLISRHACKI
ncbi:MAG: DUF4440 domain-containing protein [Saprospiraceae bacterium]|jgi:glycerophosphoryl diester phosphodiesterase|nr:DUF4440 domain-containing protein [Saprospiraceae bacterium]